MKAIFPKFNLTLLDWGFILLCSIPAFYLLGTPYIYIWDEAVYANASWDMAHGASWWVPSIGEYNTKPPLVLWLQSICLLLVPSPEWAHAFAEHLQIPGYDAAVVGYPQRMRDYNTRNKKHPDLR